MRELLAERRGDARLLFAYGRTLSYSGLAGLAEWPLREAMKDPEWLEPAGLLLATNSARSRNFDIAIEIASKILEAKPDHTGALLIRSSAYAHSKIHDEEALADVARLLELEPDNNAVLESKILALIGLGRIDELTLVMEELGKRIDEGDLGAGASAWHCATMAIFANDGGDLELADSRWTRCLESYPGESEVVMKSVHFYDAQENYERSMEILAKAAESDPSSRVYRVVLAERLRGRGAADAAEQVLRLGTEVEQPEVAAGAWLDLAKHYQAVENYTAAAEAVGRTVEMARAVSQPNPSLLLEYADALLISGQFDRALEIADEMTYVPHQNMIRARIAQEQGNNARALEYFDAAFQLWPDNPWARYYAALAAEALGEFDRAIEQYRYSIRISPGATDARTRVARLHLAEGKTGAAVQLLRIKAHEAALEPEGDLLSLELFARTGRGGEIVKTFNQIRAGMPMYIGRALASAAKGLYDRAGPARAVKSLREVGEIDIADLNYAAALRALVEYSVAAGQVREATVDLDAALAVNPDAASLREIAAFRLELTGAPQEEIRAAYNKALELEPENALALSGLGRLALPADPAQALSFFDRSAAASPKDAQPRLQAARALVALGRKDEAEERLNQLLNDHQIHGEAAALLAELQLARGLSSDRTLDLAKRAVRFGGGVEALELLARVHGERDELAESQQASEQARIMRENQSS
ncbi:MAG: tetratricopeptide repeat protein [Deltaproteobacteria bacterium]|nr:tetratricopeptide repeat protein [Deltaproteobacteria bacterium]